MKPLGFVKKFALREKFVAVVSIVIIVSMFVISGYLIKRQNEIYHQELYKRGQAMAGNLAYNSEYGVILESSDELENLLKGVAMSDDILYAIITSADGRILASTGNHLRERAKLLLAHNADDRDSPPSKTISSHYQYRAT